MLSAAAIRGRNGACVNPKDELIDRRDLEMLREELAALKQKLAEAEIAFSYISRMYADEAESCATYFAKAALAAIREEK